MTVLSIEESGNHAKDEDGLTYLAGFGNEFESSGLPGALPVGRNNPRKVPYNLYAEQLSGTAFTKPRALNRRTWLYRIQPSVAAAAHVVAVPLCNQENGEPVCFGHTSPSKCEPEVNPLRWHPKPDTSNSTTTFIEGCHLMCHGGSPDLKNGLAIYIYEFQASMNKTCFCNADGEFLIVPQEGSLEIVTEFGKLRVKPKEIVVIPRGIVFSVNLWHGTSVTPEAAPSTGPAKGYVLEVYGGDGFQLPELGPIGANGLANPRDFLHPVADCIKDPHIYQQQQQQQEHVLIRKMCSQLFRLSLNHSPYNVVAWHGNYLPYKYSLDRFCAVNSVTYDHLDPSIYTVLTCPAAGLPGTALADFVIFPPRVMATDNNTLRPPWFHRNTMSEYMGLIYGQYDAKPTGFRPGGASLHNCMVPHGPDCESYTKAVQDECLTPVHFNKGLAFMFETYLPLKVTPTCRDDTTWLDTNYAASSWYELSAQEFTGWSKWINSEALEGNTEEEE